MQTSEWGKHLNADQCGWEAFECIRKGCRRVSLEEGNCARACIRQMWKVALQASVARIASLLASPPFIHRPQVHPQEASLERREPWGLSAQMRAMSDCTQETRDGTRARLELVQVREQAPTIGTRRHSQEDLRPRLHEAERPMREELEREPPTQDPQRPTSAEEQAKTEEAAQAPQRTANSRAQEGPRQRAQGCTAQVGPWPRHP